jgi:hypothetical protein
MIADEYSPSPHAIVPALLLVLGRLAAEDVEPLNAADGKKQSGKQQQQRQPADPRRHPDMLVQKEAEILKLLGRVSFDVRKLQGLSLHCVCVRQLEELGKVMWVMTSTLT